MVIMQTVLRVCRRTSQGKSQDKKQISKRPYGRCALVHEPRKLPAFGKMCSRCGKRNRFARVCNSVRDSAKKVNQVDDVSNENDFDEEYVKKTFLGWMRSGARRKATVKFLRNSVKDVMASDSGASVNVMDEERFLKIQERSAEKLYLEKTKIKLYGYVSETPIHVAGKFKAVIGTGNSGLGSIRTCERENGWRLVAWMRYHDATWSVEDYESRR